MTTFPSPQQTAPPPSIEPSVLVSMFDDHLVICAPAHLDLHTTEILVVAAAGAVASGSTVMIDLDPDTTSNELCARRPLSAVSTNCIADPSGPVSVLAAGYVGLSTRDAYWTIDLARGRLCRSDTTIEPHFVKPDDWTPIQALWVTPTTLTALTDDGTYLSTLAAWTAHHAPTHHVRAGRLAGSETTVG